MRGYAAIGLDRPKTPANLGHVVRAAGCYSVPTVLVSGRRMRAGCTDTQCYHKHNPVIFVEDLLSCIPYDCVPVAIEITDDAVPLTTFHHPDRALYIFGPEDGSVKKEIIERCYKTIYIPTRYCMNLAATVNVVLYDRLLKRNT